MRRHGGPSTPLESASTPATGEEGRDLRASGDEVARLAEELRYQRDLMRTLTDNAAIALFMMDKDGYPIFMNPAACAMTGYSGIEEIRDRPLHYAVHFKRPDGSPYPMEECPIDQANAQIRALKDQPEVWCRKDGSLFPVRYNVAPVERAGERLGAVIEVRDVTEQLRHEEERARLLREAEASRARLHALFLQAPAAIAIVDGPDHVFSFVNTRYLALVGKSEAELLGTPAGEALPHLVSQGFITLLDRVRETGEPYRAEGVPFQREGLPETLYHNFVYQPVRDPAGRVDSIMGLAIDVTAQVKAQAETRQLAAALEARVRERTRELTAVNHELRKANEVLQSFAYVVSHDLKEPVRAIENYLSAAAEEGDTEEGRGFLRKALEANRRQHALIQGLLAYSRTSLGAVELEPIDLGRLVAEGCRGYYEATAQERGARVEVGPLPRVKGNEVLLSQLFGNLVLNAIRHNPRPSPRVRVHAAPAAEGHVEILVDDDGPGFPEDVKRRLGDLTGARPSTIKGGFGLAISHLAAERLGGALWLDAAPEGGGRVHVRLQGAG